MAICHICLRKLHQVTQLKGFFLAGLSLAFLQVANASSVAVITGMPYNKARELLMSTGWQPVSTVLPNDELFGQAKQFREIGYNEVNDCAGTGASPCVFYFKNADGGKLKVVTLGESDLKGEDFPKVDNYDLVEVLPNQIDEKPLEISNNAKEALSKADISKPSDGALAAKFIECAAWVKLGIDYAPDKAKVELIVPAVDLFKESAKKLSGSVFSQAAYITYYKNAYGALKYQGFKGQGALNALMNDKINECVGSLSKSQDYVASLQPRAEDDYPVLMLPDIAKYPQKSTYDFCSRRGRMDRAAAMVREKGIDEISALKFMNENISNKVDREQMQVSVVTAYELWPSIRASQMEDYSFNNCLQINKDEFVEYEPE